MAKLTKIKALNKGYRAVRNSPGVHADLLKRARAIAGSASKNFGGLFISDVQKGALRSVAMVKAADEEAFMAVSEHNALEKSMDAGRD